MRVLYINTFDPAKEVHGGATVTRAELEQLRAIAEVDTLFTEPLRRRFRRLNYLRLLWDLLAGRSLKCASYGTLHRPAHFYQKYDLIFCSHDFTAYDHRTFAKLGIPFIVRKINSEHELVGHGTFLRRLEAERIRRFEEHLGRVAKAVIHISSTEFEADQTSRRKFHLFPPIVSEQELAFHPGERYVFSERPIDLLCITNFNWPPNREGMDWFLSEVHPRLGPGRSIHLVGLGGERYAGRPGVTVHGFVKDLLEFYSRAKIFVAPVLSGAGIKVKSLSAILAGVPLLSTTRGADGLAEAARAGAITICDGAERFAAGVEKLLSDEQACARQRALALEWARRDVTSPEAWRQVVRSIIQ